MFIRNFLLLRPVPGSFGRIPCRPSQMRLLSSSSRTFQVTLDDQSLYIPRELAIALGWPGNQESSNKADRSGETATTLPEGVDLKLHGCDPHFFVISQAGSEAGSSLCSQLRNGFEHFNRETCSKYGVKRSLGHQHSKSFTISKRSLKSRDLRNVF